MNVYMVTWEVHVVLTVKYNCKAGYNYILRRISGRQRQAARPFRHGLSFAAVDDI